MVPFVAFSGSRSLGSVGGPLFSVVQSVLSSGRGVAVGDAVGVDSSVLSSVLTLGFYSACRVFCLGGVDAAGIPFGFWRGSCVDTVMRAYASGIQCVWQAGGGLQASRGSALFGRSRAMIRFASQTGPGSGLVAFVAGGFESSPGSWGTVAHALAIGLPVVVFPVGCPASCLVMVFRCCGQVIRGSWVQASSSGAWSGGYRFVPAVG